MWVGLIQSAEQVTGQNCRGKMSSQTAFGSEQQSQCFSGSQVCLPGSLQTYQLHHLMTHFLKLNQTGKPHMARFNSV